MKASRSQILLEWLKRVRRCYFMGKNVLTKEMGCKLQMRSVDST